MGMYTQMYADIPIDRKIYEREVKRVAEYLLDPWIWDEGMEWATQFRPFENPPDHPLFRHPYFPKIFIDWTGVFDEDKTRVESVDDQIVYLYVRADVKNGTDVLMQFCDWIAQYNALATVGAEFGWLRYEEWDNRKLLRVGVPL